MFRSASLLFRSTSLRMAALYTAIFSLCVLAIGVAVLLLARTELTQQLDQHIDVESAALATEYRNEGLEGVIHAVRDRDNTPGALTYGLESRDGRAIAGRLAGRQAPLKRSVVYLEQPGHPVEHVRVLSTALPDGYRLLVGDNIARMEAFDGVILHAFGWAFLGVVTVGAALGALLGRDFGRRLGAIRATADAIIDGDLSRRVPAPRSSDDLGRLTLTINGMLDRIQALMESLKQVSNNIAHDLRTPLTRLRQHLEQAQAATPERSAEIEEAIKELDGALETFAALLTIAQLEAGGPRNRFQQVDLRQMAQTVVEAFAPSAEEQGRELVLDADASVLVEGDPELLVQLLINLIENALRHTPSGAHVVVRLRASEGAGLLSVCDDGPGIPEDERQRVFERFYRLETSRTTPGNGLGLALVLAIAKLHQAEIVLISASPGLEARTRFPLAA